MIWIALWGVIAYLIFGIGFAKWIGWYAELDYRNGEPPVIWVIMFWPIVLTIVIGIGINHILTKICR